MFLDIAFDFFFIYMQVGKSVSLWSIQSDDEICTHLTYTSALVKPRVVVAVGVIDLTSGYGLGSARSGHCGHHGLLLSLA